MVVEFVWLLSASKRHDPGPAFWERNYDGALAKLFMTEPLWGVGSSAPHGHDGRSINLRDVILRHGGEALASRNSFAALSQTQKGHTITFLSGLVLFPPDDTASNLDPGDRNNPAFPQRGHGSIRLPEIFNNPSSWNSARPSGGPASAGPPFFSSRTGS